MRIIATAASATRNRFPIVPRALENRIGRTNHGVVLNREARPNPLHHQLQLILPDSPKAAAIPAAEPT